MAFVARRSAVKPGTTEFDTYVLEALMPDLVGHDRSPSSFIVALALWHRTRTDALPSVQVSLGDTALATGLSKRSVQVALAHLGRRRLVAVERDRQTAVPVYTVLRPRAAS
jgi:hypothetical protein